MQQRSNPLDWIDICPGVLKVDEFPDGSFRYTVVLDEDQKPESFYVTLKSTLPEAIVAVHQVCTAIIGLGTEAYISLEVQTFPDQRADRIETPGMTNAALVSARLIALSPVDSIIVHDLHSYAVRVVLKEVCAKGGIELDIYEPLDDLIDTLYDVWPDAETPRFDHVVAVDKGAVERAKQVAAHFGSQVIYADKKRVDGKVVRHVLDGFPDRPVYANDTIWIVDDLCDGGATFISIAKLLRDNFNFGDLNLYVTHGLFSKGKDELNKYYNNVISRFDYSA